MTTLVNGSKSQQVSASDRGLLYGQSVFETIAVYQEQPLLLQQHFQRLRLGCSALAIPFDDSFENHLREDTLKLSKNQHRAVIRLCMTMGEGGRGYQNPTQQIIPTRILSRHRYPEHPKSFWHDGIELGLVEIRLSSQPALAGFKHGNRLEQIIARSEWQENWQEALIRNQAGDVIEATQSNVFVIRGKELLTPELDQCGVAGIMRDWVLSKVREIGVTATIVPLSVPDIETADEVFLTNSLIGLWPVKRFRKSTYQKPVISHRLLNLMKKNEVIPSI